MPAQTRDAYPEYDFGQFTEVDGTVRFYARVHALIEPDDVVLDVGCGRGQRSRTASRFRHELIHVGSRAAHVIGIDVDPAAAVNPLVSEFRLIEDTARWPVDDASVDLIVSDYVLEHVDDPDGFFREVVRVLRPGGTFCARTPNKNGYVGLASRAIPNRFHARVVGRVQVSRDEEDVFPTFYRANTASALRRLLRRHGMSGVVMRAEAEPNYFRFSPLLYRIGARLSPLIPPPLRNGLTVFARTAAAPAGAVR